MRLSAHPAYHQGNLLSSDFNTSAPSRYAECLQISHTEFFSVLINLLRRFRRNTRKNSSGVYHFVADCAEPCKIRDFIDTINVKRVLNVMTVFRNFRRQFNTTAFTFSAISVIGILTVHVVLEVVFTTSSFGEARNIHIFWRIDRWPLLGRGTIPLLICSVDISPLFSIWSHSLVEWSAFLFTVSDKRIG